MQAFVGVVFVIILAVIGCLDILSPLRIARVVIVVFELVRVWSRVVTIPELVHDASESVDALMRGVVINVIIELQIRDRVAG